ncbi:MAG TPA: TRAP transporter substrate-binding protein [Burkholderiaceae bacterium]|nr:TRAP transporter substrate-binding protein [Burkholderiaceae bacterium]
MSDRRSFLKNSAAGAVATGALAAPAIVSAQSPNVQWRLASSFPKSLDTIFGGAETLSKRVAAATGGKFQIRVFAGGEIVPAFQVADAVGQGTVECGHTASYYYVGKHPAFAFDCALPFGMNARQQTAWMNDGGGLQLTREFFKQFGFMNFAGGNTGCQMGGWFRKEVKSLADVKGLKMRIPGFGGRVFAAMGAVPQQIPGGEIYQSLERGTIDAAEWIGPYDDEKLGLAKIAKFYYYPGWWEPAAQLSFYVNIKAWEALPAEYKAIFEAACQEAHITMLAAYDAKNPAALQRLVNSGAQLRGYPNDVMQAAYKAAMAIYDEESAKDAQFKKIYDPWTKFLRDQQRWFRVAEAGIDNFRPAAAPAAKK